MLVISHFIFAFQNIKISKKKVTASYFTPKDTSSTAHKAERKVCNIFSKLDRKCKQQTLKSNLISMLKFSACNKIFISGLPHLA